MADYKAAVDVFFNKAVIVERKNIVFSKNSKSVTGSIISDIVCLLFLLVTCHKGKHLSWQESAAKTPAFIVNVGTMVSLPVNILQSA